MRTRLAASLVLSALAVWTGTTARASQPPVKEWRAGAEDPLLTPEGPILFRVSAGTTWVQVHTPEGSPCDPADVADSPESQTVEHVWCFEGASGDSTWPAVPPEQDTGSRSEDFDHWSYYAPPSAPGPKWHITTRHENPNESDTYNAWAGCDSLNTSGLCSEVGFWVFKNGYGDEWNFPLELDTSGQNATTGGEIRFDLRYDTECNYDYLYLEYLHTGLGLWTVLVDSAGTPAVFNSVSGNPDTTQGGTGRDCGDDIYHHSDERVLAGPDPEPYHGNSIWLEEIRFPMPAQTGGLKIRWRAESDHHTSDEDGRADTDGLAAIDNVRLEFAANGVIVIDDFETGDFHGITATSGYAAWIPHGLVSGNTYDGWHLAFDPMYRNQGNTCTFSDDWMWAAKPETGSIPPEAAGYVFFLVTPVIDTDGWTGGVVEYSEYVCMPIGRDKFINTRARVYDSELGAWGSWIDFDGFWVYGGCEFWTRNETDDLTPRLGATVDSLQYCWIAFDVAEPGEFQWGKHGGLQYLIDNVSIGSFDCTATVFTLRSNGIFADTFSRSDPAHTPYLANDKMGFWSGLPGHTRDFAATESLSVEITDFNGVTASNVFLWWRHDDGGSGAFGSWSSKVMDFSSPDATSPSDEGTYRQIFGNDLGGVEDAEGTADNGLIWKAGTTVDYYIKVLDDTGQETAITKLNDQNPFEFSVLPMGNTTANGNRILLVDDYGRALLDFERSTGFHPTGGGGFGSFANPVLVEPEVLVTEALGLIYEEDFQAGAAIIDKYDVQGAGTTIQTEPRGVSDAGAGIGGYMNDFGLPNYDAILWMQGEMNDEIYADDTRLDLQAYIENGGHFLSSGDEVSFVLGSGGSGLDDAFLRDYLGTSFQSGGDDATDNRILDIAGEPGSEYAGFAVGLYGECPIRRAFDRLTLATPPAILSENRVLFRYANSTANDNGRPAVIYNQRFADADHTQPQGDAINFGFGLSALRSRVTLAAILDVALHDIFGLADPGYDPVHVPGLTAPAGFAFDLSPAAPNPLRESASIAFSIAKRTHVSIEVFNVLGQKVRTIVDGVLDPNAYERVWDGRSEDGSRVSSGIYFYKMVAGDFTDTKKAVVLR